MSTEKKSNTERKNQATKLKVIKGGKYPKTKKDIAVENLWLFTHAALWNTQLFTEEETEEFKNLLSEYFKGQRNIDKTFKQLVERVCLAKRYLARKKGRYISKPIDWLNINYKNGLAGTASWYKTVAEQRLTVPHYNEGISALANSVFNFCEKPSLKELHQSRLELIRLKQHDLLQTYMNTIIYVKFFAA